MITKFLLQLRILPRWIIILLDLSIVAFSTFIGFLLRFNFNFDEILQFGFITGVVVNTVTCLIALFITKSYAGIVRYTGLKDGLRVFYTLFLAHALTSAVNLIFHYNDGHNFIPYSVVLISLLASFVFMFQYRLLIKNIFSYYRGLEKKKQNVGVFGAGQMGILTKHLMDDDAASHFKAVAFFEDDVNKIGKDINGTLIYSFEEIESIVNKFNLQELIIAVQQLSVARKNEIVDQCLRLDLKVRTVPSLDKWVMGELSLNQIKEINIDDLLDRDSIKLNNKTVIENLFEMTILITGAAGSIGSEIVRQTMGYYPKEIILIDQSESALYEIYRECHDVTNIKITSYVADITDIARMKAIFSRHMPNIIYHAAAYKHVPFMEDNVTEAICCNILGTRNLANLAVDVQVDKFVMVSTDKAVNPTNVMGCSKRIAEIYVQSLNNSDQNKITKFITTRFGNVLGSNGSVIPYFKKQIAQGGPITVTHPDITRYFMTISEACELVIEAGVMGQGGEIFLFDMGQSVKIIDLAKKMIRLSGYKPYDDIDIVFTGLRNGEKLYEELLANSENTLPTHHEKIMIANVKEYDFETIGYKLKALELMVSHDAIFNEELEFALVSKMKSIVPEYISQSSKYMELDKKVE